MTRNSIKKQFAILQHPETPRNAHAKTRQSTVDASIGIERSRPPSKEDALAARLRSLRNTPEREEPSPSRHFKVSQPAAARKDEKDEDEEEKREDPFLETDDQTLEELLLDEDSSSGAPAWAAADASTAVEPDRVEALLGELSRDLPSSPPKDPDQSTKSASGEADLERRDTEEQERDPHEDSEGEDMSRDVDKLMAQFLDQAKLDAEMNPETDSGPGEARYGHNENEPAAQGGSSASGNLPPSGGPTPDAGDEFTAGNPSDSSVGLALPSVPSAIAAATGTAGSPPAVDGSTPPFSLPSVPSAKRGTNQMLSSNTSPPRSSVDFENDLAARMAALSAPSTTTSRRAEDDHLDDDNASMGLPSVPTSKPVDRSHVKRLTTRTGYTDDDQRGWCTVCLDDATLRCLGCDDDDGGGGSGSAYCTRCWQEMHVGPAAAFDDRTHKAVLLDKDRKKKKEGRVMLGA